jgi:hypothetical protein
MWSAPMLTDLNVANNSLKELPAPTVVGVKTTGRHMKCMLKILNTNLDYSVFSSTYN